MAIVSQKTDARNEKAGAGFVRAANKGLVRDGTGRVLCPIGGIPEAFTTDVADVQGQFPVVYNTDRMPAPVNHNDVVYYDNTVAGGALTLVVTPISLGKGVVSEEGSYILLDINYDPFYRIANGNVYANNFDVFPLSNTATDEFLIIDNATGQLKRKDINMKGASILVSTNEIIEPYSVNTAGLVLGISHIVNLIKPTNIMVTLNSDYTCIGNMPLGSRLLLGIYVQIDGVDVGKMIEATGTIVIDPLQSFRQNNNISCSSVINVPAGVHTIGFRYHNDYGVYDNYIAGSQYWQLGEYESSIFYL